MLSALVIFSLLAFAQAGQRCSAASSISVDQGYYDKNSCGEYTRQQLCGGASGASVWYAFYLPAGTALTKYVVSAYTTSSNYQLQVALYNSCQDSSYFACNYSATSTQAANVEYYLESGRYYYVQVTTLGDYSVDFALSLYTASLGPPAAWQTLTTCMSTDLPVDFMDMTYTPTPGSDCPLNGYDPDCYNDNWECFNDCFAWTFDNWEDFDQCEYFKCLTECYAAPECKEVAEYYCCVQDANMDTGKFSEDSYECVNVGCPETRMDSIAVFVIVTFSVIALCLGTVIAIVCFIRRRNLRPKYTMTGTDAGPDSVTVVYPGTANIQE